MSEKSFWKTEAWPPWNGKLLGRQAKGIAYEVTQRDEFQFALVRKIWWDNLQDDPEEKLIGVETSYARCQEKADVDLLSAYGIKLKWSP